jgi:hypothetical protein
MEDAVMKRLSVFLAISTVFIVSCASTPELPDVGKMLRDTTGQNGRACIRQGDIRSFGVLENDVVSIDGTRKYYLATVMPGCHDLHTSVRAMFSGGFGEVCGGTTNKIVTRGDRCIIRQMFEFKNRKEAFAAHNAVLEERKMLKHQAAEQEP